MNGLARVNMATGETQYWHLNRVPTTSAVVATAGDILFWGDIDGKQTKKRAGAFRRRPMSSRVELI